MLRKRIKKNTLKWKKIYAEQLLDMMDEEENALQKIYLTGYVLELKKKYRYAAAFPIGMVQIVIVCYPVLMQIKKLYLSNTIVKLYFVQSSV